MSRKKPEHTSFYQAELLPSERKDLALAVIRSVPLPPVHSSLLIQGDAPAAGRSPAAGSPFSLFGLENAPPPPLADEIDLLRVIIRRMFALSKEQTPEDAVRTLALLSTMIMRLAGVIRTQQQILYDQRHPRSQSARSQGNGIPTAFQNMLEDLLTEAQADWPKL